MTRPGPIIFQSLAKKKHPVRTFFRTRNLSAFKASRTARKSLWVKAAQALFRRAA